MRPLTPTERAVVRILALYGASDREIARRLEISPNTARTHVANIMRKLGQHRRAEVVAWAWRTGFVHASPGSRGAA